MKYFREIVFVDAALKDWQNFLAGLDRNVETVWLDPFADGLKQIAAHLAQNQIPSLPPLESFSQFPEPSWSAPQPYDAIHIISHGSSGQLQLGTTLLNAQNLSTYQEQLQQIGTALTDNGDLLLYGCNVAEGEAGEQFITALAAATGADVAASTDLTGAEVLGGDGELEANNGIIETSAISLSSYQNVLVSADVRLATTGLYLRDFILQNGNFYLPSFNSGISTEYNYLENIQINRNAILEFLDDLPFLPDFKPYDVTGALFSTIKIDRINSDFQAIQDQITVIRNALSEVSDSSASWFDSNITYIINTYNSDVADLPGFGADELWEATGFVSSAVGNITDLIFDQLEDIHDIGGFLISSFSIVETAIFDRDAFGDRVSSVFDMIIGFIDYALQTGNEGTLLDKFESLSKYVLDNIASLWQNFGEDFSALRTGKEHLFNVITGDYSVWSISEKSATLYDEFKTFKALGWENAEILNLFFGIKNDFWINQPTTDIGDVFDVILAILEMAAIGGEKSDLQRYLDGPSDGLEFGGRDIAEITLEIKNNEWLSIITDTLVPKSLDLIASFGVIEPRVDAGLTALSEAVDTWLQSRNVSNITDLSVLIDQLTIVDEAVTNAYSQFTTVFENALSRLPDNWGSDIRLDRFIQNGDETFYGTDYSERISGSENNDKIYAGGGNDLIYGQGGHDWIVGGSGNG
jgi:hypothetical protein